MNERIQELTEQAGYVPLPGFDFANSLEEVFIKKFAELIIQDIINTVLIQARWYQEVEKDDNTVTALCDLVKDIREEYGVS